ncbi:HAD family hydrolase [Pyrococcus furiosus DSM 3638]|uniref:Hydrolase related to 2-haloalkanoic acid dehalogenase n=3 Tax=Pyrococcus furiosus TaxID=2261 RepID=Q8U031_PYRFU|nr:HAD family hydrolase [Pyrococcus furiosus]AAL81913.1 hydrolase related to 2-haloalkanoic acid dehalogenase [Pyrococcus furiosus DSM 3638]AFN04852.1 hydrolase related to 2-haloalkanoic acid dehalogenase [Pyrococcus furiosus COM1]QEK79391.1 HAD family hydrolase [Pyrococcus furiosus DSM 3638]
MIKGVIFDVDETLVYYEGYSLKEWYEKIAKPTMKKLGILIDWETFRKMAKGELPRSYVEEFGIDHVTFWKALDKANRRYREELLNEGKIRTYDDVEAIKELKKLGLKLAAVSNASQDNTELVLKAFNLLDYFDVVYGKDYTYLDGVKPNPYLINKALNTLGLRPDEAILVGDSDLDIIAGKRAGVTVVQIVREKKYEGADYYIQNLWELVDLIKRSRC